MDTDIATSTEMDAETGPETNADLGAGVGMFLARLLLAVVVGVMILGSVRAGRVQQAVPLGEWTWQEMG